MVALKKPFPIYDCVNQKFLFTFRLFAYFICRPIKSLKAPGVIVNVFMSFHRVSRDQERDLWQAPSSY